MRKTLDWKSFLLMCLKFHRYRLLAPIDFRKEHRKGKVGANDSSVPLLATIKKDLFFPLNFTTRREFYRFYCLVLLEEARMFFVDGLWA